MNHLKMSLSSFNEGYCEQKQTAFQLRPEGVMITQLSRRNQHEHESRQRPEDLRGQIWAKAYH